MQGRHHSLYKGCLTRALPKVSSIKITLVGPTAPPHPQTVVFTSCFTPLIVAQRLKKTTR